MVTKPIYYKLQPIKPKKGKNIKTKKIYEVLTNRVGKITNDIEKFEQSRYLKS